MNKIRLQRADEPPPDDPLFVPHLLEDELVYDDLAPWASDADGMGKSLTRVAGHAWGNAATSWTAEAPTPGTATLTPLGDMDLSGSVEEDDIRKFVLGLNDATLYQLEFNVPATLNGDLDQDGDLDFDDIDELVAILEAAAAVDVQAHVESALFVPQALPASQMEAADLAAGFHSDRAIRQSQSAARPLPPNPIATDALFALWEGDRTKKRREAQNRDDDHRDVKMVRSPDRTVDASYDGGATGGGERTELNGE